MTVIVSCCCDLQSHIVLATDVLCAHCFVFVHTSTGKWRGPPSGGKSSASTLFCPAESNCLPGKVALSAPCDHFLPFCTGCRVPDDFPVPCLHMHTQGSPPSVWCIFPSKFLLSCPRHIPPCLIRALDIQYGAIHDYQHLWIGSHCLHWRQSIWLRVRNMHFHWGLVWGVCVDVNLLLQYLFDVCYHWHSSVSTVFSTGPKQSSRQGPTCQVFLRANFLIYSFNSDTSIISILLTVIFKVVSPRK